MSGFSVPLTALFVFAIIVFLVAAVGFRWFEVDVSWGKMNLKIHRPAKPAPPAALIAPPPPGVTEEQQDLPIGAIQPGAGAQADEKGPEEEPSFTAYFAARTVADLDRAYPKFAVDIDGEENEFWETDYRSRRTQYGADNGRHAMQQLASNNPSWAYPYAILVEWSMKDHDPHGAEQHLAAGLARQSSPQFGYILSAGVRLRFMLGGARAAAAFCAEWSKADIPERMKAGAFTTLAEVLKNAGDLEGHRVALEWAILLYPSDKRRIFSLAYSYGESEGRWSSAMWHYQRIVGPEDDGPVSRNNLGVRLGEFDKRVQVDTYELAAADGDRFARVNIALLLINDGYIAAAERLLDSVDDPGSAAELHAKARTSALAARRAMSARRGQIEATIEAHSDGFRKSLSRAFRHTRTNVRANGFYASADNLIVVGFNNGQLHCRLRIGTLDYEGPLRDQGTCFAGQLEAPGKPVLGGYSVEITILEEDSNLLRFFRWPERVGEQHAVHEEELRQVEVPPPPLPPIPPPPPATVNSLLALGKS